MVATRRRRNVSAASSCTRWCVKIPVGSSASTSPRRRACRCPIMPPSAACSPIKPRFVAQATRSICTFVSAMPGDGQGVRRGFRREIAPRPQAASSGRKARSKTIPRRRQNREHARPEKCRQPISAFYQFGSHGATRALRWELVLFAIDGMVRVAPAVLQDGKMRCFTRPRQVGDPFGEFRMRGRRNHRKRNRNITRDRNEAVEPAARRHRIVIPPPEGCDPACSLPTGRTRRPDRTIPLSSPNLRAAEASCADNTAGELRYKIPVHPPGNTRGITDHVQRLSRAERRAPPISTEIIRRSRLIARSTA